MAVAGAHRYWRIYVNSGYNSAWLNVNEVELRVEVGGADVTTSSTPVTASSTYPSYPTSNVVDGSTSTTWVNSGSTSSNQWLSFDLSVATAIAEVAVYVTDSRPKYVIIQYSDDNITYTAATDVVTLVDASSWQTIAVEQAPPDPNAPVTTKLYPNGVKNVGSFSNAANLVGSSQTAATNTLSLDAVAGIYTELLLNFSTIPAGAVISTVVAKVKAKTSASNTRRLANVLADAYYTTGGGSSKAFDLGSVQLTTTETTYSKSLTWAELTATIPEAKLRDANMVFVINVWGNGSTTTTATTTISGFWLEVTYTLPSGGVNVLFLGEMF